VSLVDPGERDAVELAGQALAYLRELHRRT
jgi:hypothetical protein